MTLIAQALISFSFCVSLRHHTLGQGSIFSKRNDDFTLNFGSFLPRKRQTERFFTPSVLWMLIRNFTIDSRFLQRVNTLLFPVMHEEHLHHHGLTVVFAPVDMSSAMGQLTCTEYESDSSGPKRPML
ncbi:hypothetical protein BDM02DRAFT_382727 [Thelephora ganbajun]|uniref:Uncharacterized protein n=1 Tax=Thelephora ganbajun TaxID=370292 RepID=A0ACB6Z8K9_THEGA|nr:hypothetical protein BDM02DRAFT_382727 [Thelephora ganbajun]